jgi:hypothetical protein
MTETQRVKKVINWLVFMEYAENERELAEKLGYTKSSFSQIVNGKVPLCVVGCITDGYIDFIRGYGIFYFPHFFIGNTPVVEFYTMLESCSTLAVLCLNMG